MKKNLLYLFTFVCCLGLFAACSDDDDDPKTEPWKELSKTYQDDKLKINEYEVASEKTVVVDATSEEAATLTLNNVVPDDKAVKIEAKLAKSGEQYTVSGEATVGACVVSVSGKFVDGALNLTVGRNLSSAVTGNLSLQFDETGVPVHWVAVTGDQVTDIMLAQAGPMIGGLMAAKVTAVDVKLPANGTFDVTWTTVAGETVGMPNEIKQIVQIQYAVIDGKFYLVLDKAYLPMLQLLPAVMGVDIDVEAFLTLFDDLGGYYGLPLEYKEEGSVITFIANKQMVVSILSMVGPMIQSSVPEAMQPMFEALLKALPGAQQLELGLPFVKK